MVAATPPTVTDTGASGLGSTSTAGRPSTPGGSVTPSPVPQRTTTEPAAAGFDAEFRLPSWLRIAPWPLPLASAVNRPGAVGETVSGKGSERTPWYST